MNPADTAIFAAFELDIASDHAAWALQHGVAPEDVAAALCHSAGLHLSRGLYADVASPAEDAIGKAEWVGWDAYNRARLDQRANPRTHRKPRS